MVSALQHSFLPAPRHLSDEVMDLAFTIVSSLAATALFTTLPPAAGAIFGSIRWVLTRHFSIVLYPIASLNPLNNFRYIDQLNSVVSIGLGWLTIAFFFGSLNSAILVCSTLIANQALFSIVNALWPSRLFTPPTIDQETAELLQGYTLASQSTHCPSSLEALYNELPEPTEDERNTLAESVRTILSRVHVWGYPISRQYIEIILFPTHPTAWNERFIKMLLPIVRLALEPNSPHLERIQASLAEAFTHCINRQTSEIEELFFTLVAPSALQSLLATQTPAEKFAFDLTQYRIELSGQIIGTLCPDAHNAASHKYFHRRLNENTFHLYSAPLSAEDFEYEPLAARGEEIRIVDGFKTIYHSPHTPYHVLRECLEGRRQRGQLTNAIFLDWIIDTDRREMALRDDGTYTPEILIAFLEEHGFIKHRSCLTRWC